MQILDATAAHAAGITAVYNHVVQHTTAIWNDDTVDVRNRADWIAARQQADFPVLVAVDEAGAVLGYASCTGRGARTTATATPSSTPSTCARDCAGAASAPCCCRPSSIERGRKGGT